MLRLRQRGRGDRLQHEREIALPRLVIQVWVGVILKVGGAPREGLDHGTEREGDTLGHDLLGDVHESGLDEADGLPRVRRPRALAVGHREAAEDVSQDAQIVAASVGLQVPNLGTDQQSDGFPDGRGPYRRPSPG